MRLILPLVLLVMATCVLSQDDPDALYKDGLERLRAAQADHSALVPATKLLARAAALYEARGDDVEAAEVNSCLYWAKKKMTLADTETLKGNAEVSQRLEAVAKPVAVTEAQGQLLRADISATNHADDPLFVAIQYFAVADRFKDSDVGREAMDKSLKAMQKIGEKTKLAEYKPVSTDGKAYIQSDPPGAAVVLHVADGRQDTGKKTPSLVQLPKGQQTLSLLLDGMKPTTTTVMIGDTIAKPALVKLEPVTVPVDIMFEGGWAIFVDGKPAKAIGSGKAETPGTVELPLGRHDIGLAKEGFLDVRQQVEIVESGVKSTGGAPSNSIEIKTKPSKGTGPLVATTRAAGGVEGQARDAAMSFKEEMGYTVGVDLKTGSPYHNNFGTTFTVVPKELEGRQYTQVVAYRVTPVTIRFDRAGVLYLLVQLNSLCYQPNLPVLTKHCKREAAMRVLSSQGEQIEVWSIIGAPGSTLTFPSQIMLVAETLTKVKRIEQGR